ncbi:MAG: class I SAM-dependent rRNA methyltransferase [Desulfuromonadales bacterium]|nr:class I SAM-dependent rRNA methyltransferase [Desulfuromonadales bacterium]
MSIKQSSRLHCPVGPETLRMLQLGHPWVIADRYTARWPKAASGALVNLVSDHGDFLGTALLDPGSRVVARLLDRQQINLDAAWLGSRLATAARLRCWLELGDTTVWRLVNGEGDGLPGLTIDRYGDYLLVQYYTLAWEPHLPAVVQALMATCRPRGIYGKFRPQQTRAAGGLVKGRLLAGTGAPEPLVVVEHGLRYCVDLDSDLHTGLFLDQRRNRVAFRCQSAGQRVLNLFAYTGAFSVAAAAGGAERVTTIDVASRYLDRARENFRLNDFDPAGHEFIAGDCFVELEKLARGNRSFDIILMDPPSFSTTRESRFTTSGGTAELVQGALGLLPPGGLLITSSNHQKVDLADYLKELRRGALAAGRELQVIETAGQGGDFPYPVTFPEGRYLKYVVSVAG